MLGVDENEFVVISNKVKSEREIYSGMTIVLKSDIDFSEYSEKFALIC